jgi:hypothetical protein
LSLAAESPDYEDRDAITKALALCDTPAVREFIDRCWADPEQRAILLERFQSQENLTLIGLDWMMPLLEKLDDAASQQSAARLLSAIATPDAQKLLERWAQSDDESTRQAAQQQIAEHQRRMQQWSELLTGKIKPDDLLPPAQAWVWNGTEYVPEEK